MQDRASLCENSWYQSERTLGWSTDQVRVEKAPGGRGAAEQFIRKRFPAELKAHRKRHGNVSLAVLIDGDSRGVTERLAQLDAACDQEQIPRRELNEAVFIFVPTWSIETWFAYLDGEGETVAEDKRDYPRLPRERDCQQHVRKLVDMCRRRQIRESAPPSLTAGCVEYQRFLDQA